SAAGTSRTPMRSRSCSRDEGRPDDEDRVRAMKLALALLVGAAASLVAATQAIADTDLFWHLATGRETLAHGIVRTDIFSWTVRGGPVSTDQWLGQIVLYASYAALDWWGIALVRIVAVGALLTLVTLNASLGRSGRPLAMILAAVPAL